MNGGTRITSGRGKEKEGEIDEGKKEKTRGKMLLPLVLRDVGYSIRGFCQYSCAIGDEGPAAPILHTNTHK